MSMNNSTRNSTFDNCGSKGHDIIDKSQGSSQKKKTHFPAIKADTNKGYKGKYQFLQHDDDDDDDARKHSDILEENIGVNPSSERVTGNFKAEMVKEDDKNIMEEKLSKLVHILESSEDRDEKLEALRLIAEIAETLSDARMDSKKSQLDINSIPLPTNPQRGMYEIPLPTDPPVPFPASSHDIGHITKFSCYKSNGLQKTGGSEETAVTKTRLGVVTMHKNKISMLSKQVMRHSLNDLMFEEKSGKAKSSKILKKKFGKITEGETGNDKGTANNFSRKVEIQDRINAWKEELLSDMSKDPKRKKIAKTLHDLKTQIEPTANISPSSNEVVSKANLSSDTTLNKLTPLSKVAMPKDMTEQNQMSSNCDNSLLSRFSSSVLSADEKRKYMWPVEMIRNTSVGPSISYSCNPLYHEFSPHIFIEKNVSINSTISTSTTTCDKMKLGLKKQKFHHVPLEKIKNQIERIRLDNLSKAKDILPTLENGSLFTVKQEAPLCLANETSQLDVNSFDNLSDGDDNDNLMNAAKWDTSSDSETEQTKMSQYSSQKLRGNCVDSKSNNSNPTAGRKRRRSTPDSEHSFDDSGSNSDYSCRSHHRDARSRSKSRSYSSRYSSRRSSRHHRSYRSYSRSSRYSRSSDSYSSYTSSDSYYSSRSRSRKRKWRSRSPDVRSNSRDRFGRRISRSPSLVSRKHHKSSSNESKRIISHKVLPVPAKQLTSPLLSPKMKAEASKLSDNISNPLLTSIVSFPTQIPCSLNIPLPIKSTFNLASSSLTSSVSTVKSASSFIGPTLPLDHPLSATQEIPLPSKVISQEEKFQPIGPDDPLVFKSKLSSEHSKTEDLKDVKNFDERDPCASFVIPPEQAERYRALRLQAERHARKVMGGLAEEEVVELVDDSEESSNQIGDGGNPQQQLVEELYLEQMASLMAQQQQQLVLNAQAPVSRFVHIVGSQQSVPSNPQFLPLVQVGTKVVPTLHQAGAPLILAHQNASGHITAATTVLRSQTPSTGSTLVQMQAEDAMQVRARLQQTRIELAEKALSERQDWVQIVQLPQQHQHHRLILTHQLHPQGQMGFSMIHRPNIILGTAGKAPTFVQVPVAATGQIVTPTFIGAQQVVATQHMHQMALPLLIGANGQVLVPQFIR